ncbi:MAG: purine-binding chemotaxis protein CheW [Deltaproteobacteria bacterium]|nr:purine-binding chemotaxis protein CheW [Deltaproteobacteria bacterium]MBW2401276.1 purine-binding chemotaxis protein CheW [Deltaproteobacteria bacterium]MBW2666255.1 purine-binding chemotaxis protein CheW [Deltaproteobacteria bacterium]
MQSISAASFGQNHVTLGCFEVSGRTYAVDVAYVREVVRWQPVTPLPKAPALIEGVIDLRGAVVPVVDLGRALGGDRVTVENRTRIAVVEVENLVMGLVVDAVTEVLPVNVDAMEDPPSLATQAGYDTTRAIVRRPDADPILVLSLEHLLESIYRSSLPSKEEIQ